MSYKRLMLAVVSGFFVLAASHSSFAYTKNASVVNFKPATDGGRYFSVQQSNTMRQWSYNGGGYFDFAYQPLEYADNSGNRRRGIVDDLLMANFHGAIAWTDWWLMGANIPLALWETFYNPNMPSTTVTKQTYTGRMGDVRLEMKFRFLDIERYHVGLSVVPYVYFPTGKSTLFLGNGMWSPGATLVFDADIKNRVFLALNAGYRNYSRTRYDVNNTNAVLDDTLTLGGGVNVRINDTWGVIGEVYSESVLSGLFKNQLQNPAEFLVGGRFTPQGGVKGLGVTVAGGRGITTGVGSPDFRILLGVNYRHARSVPAPPPVEVEAQVEEKIVITQKIHFEFDRAVIRPISYPILDDVVSLLQRNPQISMVKVEGHTDWIGSEAYNQRLSEARANSVRNYLIEKGIAPDRLQAVGYGKTRPIADNNTVMGRARNRRTEFTVVGVGR